MIIATGIRKKIVHEAITWLGTPYHHKAKVKQAGVDCAMFVQAVAENVGLIEKGLKGPVYSNEWHLHNREEKLLQTLESFGCSEINNNKIQPGDILTFKYGRCSSHLAILIDRDYIIHAHQPKGRVCTHILSGDMYDRWHKTYRFPGVEGVE